MRALVYRGTELTLEQAYPPPTPVEGEALIRVSLMGICNTDLEIVRGYMSFNGVLGHEFVGTVEEVYGDGAQHLLGKRIVGEINAACQRADCWYCMHSMPTQCPRRTTLGILNRDGAFADYVLLPVENLHVVPENVSDEEAVFVEPLAANFEMLEQVHLKPTDRVMVLGDGKMGQLAAQVLALTGCEITMVGKHEEKLALAEKRGIATQLLDRLVRATEKADRRADVVVECSGSEQGLALAMRLVRPRGTLILKSTVAASSTLHLAPIVIDEIRVQGSRCGPFPPALRVLSQKMVDVQPLISARYALDDGLEAFRYAEQKGVLKVLMKV
ncbi:MAG TPA: alcohol dehydrogenase catalytic domain-containing protein [Ktedonobacteraceae bacterium]|nr:alcohol dehydrogenase catalytic domain-containing protein [Ktedonobacteraceae bacterium]HEV2661483.1 alcohol dehydrogenase catalytic domain-containing protein [Ktedonobacteraceae bacterium]